MHFSKNRSPALIALAILTAGLLIAMTWGPPPDRKNVVRATHQSSGTNRASAPQPPTGFRMPLAEQRLVGGYWRTDHTFQPTLIITNVMQKIELPVTPVLYAADGTEYPLPPVRLSPAGVTFIDIRAALNAAPEEIRAHFSDFGSAGVKYIWHSAGAATALVENRDVPRSLIFNFELRPPKTSMAGMATKHGASETVKEGLWWREDSGVKGFLAVVNTTPRAVNALVQVLSDFGVVQSERTIRLETNEARKLVLLDDTEGSSGGARITYDGDEGDVAVVGGLENPHEGYSAQIPFLTVSHETKPSTVQFSSVGLMLGAPDPMMKFPSGTTFGVYLALRNTTSQPILISPTLYYTQGAEVIKTALNPLPLAARQARHWTPDELSAELGLPKFDGIINLVFSYQGGRSDVIVASGSIDQTKNYVFEIKMERVSQSLEKGLKDWDVSNGNDTMISLLNVDEKDQDLAVTFFFDGGHYKLSVHLRAGESTMFNVSDIIMRQQPDADGNTIPPNTPHGTAVLAAASANLQWFKVGASLGIFNVSTATCGGQCNNCGDFVNYRVQADVPTVAVGQTAEFSAWGYSVSMGWVNVTLQSQWTSSDIQIAPPDPSIIGAFDGASPGSFTAQASATLEMGDTCPEGCDPTFWTDGQPGTITPSLTLQLGNQYSSIFVGTDPGLSAPNSIFATVNPSGGTFTETSSAASDTFAPVSSGGPGWIVTTTTQSANSGDRTLTVTYTVNSQKASQFLNVTARQFAYATNNSPSNICTLGFGQKYLYTYTPYTHPDHTAAQSGIGLSNTAVTESFNPQPPSGAGTGNGNLDSNSQFADRIEYCSTSALTLSASVTQKIFIEGYQVRQNLLTYSSSGVSLTNQGPTQ